MTFSAVDLSLQYFSCCNLSKLDDAVTRSRELMIDIEPEPSAHKENEVNSTIDFGLDDGHKEVTIRL